MPEPARNAGDVDELTAARHLADQADHLVVRAARRGRVVHDDVVEVVRALGALFDSLVVKSGDGR
jgi:hypothetical protein